MVIKYQRPPLPAIGASCMAASVPWATHFANPDDWGDLPSIQQSIMDSPPPVSPAKQLLPRSFKTAFSQLRSGHCTRLQNYHHSIGWANDRPYIPRLPCCRPHGCHLFSYPTHPTSFLVTEFLGGSLPSSPLSWLLWFLSFLTFLLVEVPSHHYRSHAGPLHLHIFSLSSSPLHKNSKSNDELIIQNHENIQFKSIDSL